MDFNSSMTLVWEQGCTQYVQNASQGIACGLAPTYAQSNFSRSNAQTNYVRRIRRFYNATIGGFMASGYQYSSRLCVPALGIEHCKLIGLYSAQNIYIDDYLYN